MTRSISLLLACALAGVTATESAAQPYEINWYTIDGGGGSIEGGSYSLSGTVGQADASGPLSGGTYTLTGGFWPGIESAQSGCNTADLTEPFGLLDLSDITVFVQAFQAEDPIADLAPPAGLFDLADLTAFVSAFLSGCP